ncbi:amidohydrolase [Aequorivita vladivostokensis]|uniref:Amidohydrolase n=1 Tax=Aequorivita vladivostokensis TaxID=171194 RepID=A0ABR5DFX9_9FLAO|nr:amidohydrolase [Aequorivita vladivostokensis]KJJ37689.1 amidohydrolase [Aequorivita vladivostokensis]MDX1783856.1 amidohydrolase [Aequorivita vladivostokensis]
MKTDLKITLVQSELIWENASANRELFSKKFQTFEGETDLIVLPEMFTTGFSMNAKKLAEPNDGESLNWMISEARKHNCAITGSVIISENDKFYNRLFFVLPDGTYEKYDKKHTFTLAKENETYTAGNERLIVNFKGWKICPLICYDLRFPVWSRNTEDYDVLIYVANWPKVRTVAWDTLLRARAIENMSYCVGVNRVGFDGNDHEYVGHSAVYDVLGKQVSPSAFDEFIETVTLSKEHIESNRKHLQFLNDRDKFTLT